MSGRTWWAEFAILVRRPATVAVLAGVFVLALVDAVQVLGRPPLGLVGTLAFNTDGVLTYGLAGSALLTTIVVSGYDALGDIWHASGRGLYERLVQALLLAVPLAVMARLIAMAGVEAGGTIDGLRRGWRWGSLVRVDDADLISGQGRQLLAYLIAAAFGGVVALAARNQTAAVAVVLAAAVPYIPFVGALANRAGPLLDVLPWAPFGALRGALSGNGGIFGNDPEHIRLVSAGPASLAILGWLAFTLAWLLLRSSLRSDTTVVMYAVPVPAAALLVIIAATWLPNAMANNVPWRWTPEWRHAKTHGDDSRQVSQRWADLVRADDPRSSELISDDTSGVDIDVADVLAAASTVRAEPESQMISPEYVRVNVTFDPKLRSGNVLLDKAQVQLRLRQVGSVWRIVRIEGPFVHVEVAP